MAVLVRISVKLEPLDAEVGSSGGEFEGTHNRRESAFIIWLPYDGKGLDNFHVTNYKGGIGIGHGDYRGPVLYKLTELGCVGNHNRTADIRKGPASNGAPVCARIVQGEGVVGRRVKPCHLNLSGGHRLGANVETGELVSRIDCRGDPYMVNLWVLGPLDGNAGSRPVNQGRIQAVLDGNGFNPSRELGPMGILLVGGTGLHPGIIGYVRIQVQRIRESGVCSDS